MAISINLYLDRRGANHQVNSLSGSEKRNDKEYPIKISITKDGSTSYLPTGIFVSSGNWKNYKVTGRPDKVILNTLLEKKKSSVMSVIFEGRTSGRYSNMSVTEIKNDVATKLKLGLDTYAFPLFLPLFEEYINGNDCSLRTKELYRATANKIRTIVPNAERLTIDEIDLTWLERYNQLLIAKGNNSSTRSIDFRNIRAVIRSALRHKIIRDNPFDDFKIVTGKSPNRALTKEQLRLLLNCEVKPWERKYLDFFLLSFLLIGINTEDLIHIKEIEGGRINYIRAKTQREMSVLVEPEAMSIIERYRGSSFLLNICDTYKNTHNWTSKVDAVLNDISKRNGLPGVTMYWARHTWATLAHIDLGIELSTISDALGHQQEKKVTLIYIKKKDYTKVDEANRRVIDYVLHS